MKTLLTLLLIIVSSVAFSQTSDPTGKHYTDSMTVKSVNIKCTGCGHLKSDGYKQFQIYKDEVYGFCGGDDCYLEFKSNPAKTVRKKVIREKPLPSSL